jgi:uncharacterized phage protein (TIGR01671 family)
MREIKFRGKRKDNDQWIYGDYCQQDAEHAALIGEWYKPTMECKWFSVWEDSVGQFTGMKDDSGNEIYEDDIVNYVTGSPKRYVNCVVEFGEYETYTHIVKEGDAWKDVSKEWDGDVEKHVGFYLKDGDKKIPLGSLWIMKIGNIYENASLIP